MEEVEAGRNLPAVSAPEEASGLVRLALEQQMPVEVLERLVALQERVTDRQAREEFFAALARLQERVPVISKAKTAQIATRGGSSYSYSYAPLEDIVAVVRPLLQEEGFSFNWTTEGIEGGILNVVCVLRHIAGHEERSAFPVPTQTEAAMSGAQKLGSALTYGKRQSLTSVLGLTTADEDTDATLGKDPGGTVTESEAADLDAFISEVGADRARFLAYFNIGRLDELPASQLQLATRMLEGKRKAP